MKPRVFGFLYYAFLIITVLVWFYFCYVNVGEIINQLSGQNTYLKQRTNFTLNQAVFYCSIWLVIFIVAIYFLIYSIIKKQNKTVILWSLAIWILLLCSYCIDSLFFNTLT